MAYYKTTDPETVKAVNLAFEQKKQKFDEMDDLAKKYGFGNACYCDHRELGMWLSGFIVADPTPLDPTKWKWFKRKDGYYQVNPKKSNRKFYKEIKQEYERLHDVCFDYEPPLRLLAGANWLAVKDIVLRDDAIYFDTDYVLTEPPTHVVEIVSGEFLAIKKKEMS